jgi:hypothetical protein
MLTRQILDLLVVRSDLSVDLVASHHVVSCVDSGDRIGFAASAPGGA